jgi:hypothetical protein
MSRPCPQPLSKYRVASEPLTPLSGLGLSNTPSEGQSDWVHGRDNWPQVKPPAALEPWKLRATHLPPRDLVGDCAGASDDSGWMRCSGSRGGTGRGVRGASPLSRWTRGPICANPQWLSGCRSTHHGTCVHEQLSNATMGKLHGGAAHRTAATAWSCRHTRVYSDGGQG